MAAWPISHLKFNPKSLDTNDLLFMDLEFSHKSSVDLIQNCDLPPPQKIFTNNSIHRVKGREEIEYGGGEEKLELLKALRLSQTRAREAEKKAAKLAVERDCISKAFLDEARLIFCYRQSVKLLELRVSKLQYHHQWQKFKEEEEEEEEESDDGGGGGIKWIWAFALCFSVAGVGFLLGYTSFM